MAARRAHTTVIAGLTGGVGAGKTAAENFLRRRGIPTADADRWAREILDGNATVQRRIARYFLARFGTDVRKAGGSIDRAAVASRVFEDRQALRFIEAEVHPRVKARAAAWCAARRRSGVPLAVLVVPLLFESGMDARVDCTVTLAAPVAERCRRLRLSRGWSGKEARARMRLQLTDAARARRADYVVDNAGTPAQLAAAMRTVIHKLRSRAARGNSKQQQ